MHAYALCANDNLPGHHVVKEETEPSSAPMQATAAVCPGGFRALGSGAAINLVGSDDIGLQVARASGSGDITRAQAHEDAGGFNGQWTLSAFAVCASTPQGYEVVYGESAERDSEPLKDATAVCPDGKQLVSSGAAITNVAPGSVSLRKVLPRRQVEEVHVEAVENDPTDVDWDFMVAQAICTF